MHNFPNPVHCQQLDNYQRQWCVTNKYIYRHTAVHGSLSHVCLSRETKIDLYHTTGSHWILHWRAHEHVVFRHCVCSNGLLVLVVSSLSSILFGLMFLGLEIQADVSAWCYKRRMMFLPSWLSYSYTHLSVWLLTFDLCGTLSIYVFEQLIAYQQYYACWSRRSV